MGRKAFIVRPFGTKSGINFEDVQRQLIEPALKACEIEGGTTEPFLEAGNIRADMFQQLLVADIVVADISIHNANVFYELGVRHALQPQKTFMIRAKSKKDPKDRGPEDDVPFNLKTDRYLQYDSDSPAATVDTLIQALRQTIASENPESPVFQMLPTCRRRNARGSCLFRRDSAMKWNSRPRRSSWACWECWLPKPGSSSGRRRDCAWWRGPNSI